MCEIHSHGHCYSYSDHVDSYKSKKCMNKLFVTYISSQFGRSPLHVASAKGHTAVVTLLLDHGADIHVKSMVCAVMWIVCVVFVIHFEKCRNKEILLILLVMVAHQES